MLIWTKGNINKTASVLQYCVPLEWCTNVQAVLASQSTVCDRACISSLSSQCLCILSLHGPMVTSFSLPFCELSMMGLVLDLVD